MFAITNSLLVTQCTHRMVRVWLVRLQYQLEVNAWLYRKKCIDNNKQSSQILLICSVHTHIQTSPNVHNYYIPVSDHMYEGSGDCCTGMRSLDGVWTVSGRTASFVGVVSAIP